MSTNNHTAISGGAAANAGTINTPLGALDAAIGNLTTLTTTAKTSAVAALNEVDANADAAAALVGTVASLNTATKTNAVAAINDTWSGIRSGAQYEARSGVTWDAATKILTIAQPAIIAHGIATGYYLSFTTNVVLDFSTYTGVTYAYVTGVNVKAVQAAYSIANIVIQARASLTRNLQDPDVYVLAVYSSTDGSIYSPFLDMAMGRDYLLYGSTLATYSDRLVDGYDPRNGALYEARGGIAWNATAKTLTLAIGAYISHGIPPGNYLSFVDPVVLDFSAYTGNIQAWAYVTGVDVATTQAGYSIANIAVESRTELTRNLTDADVYVLAVYTGADNSIYSPFLNTKIATQYLADISTVEVDSAAWSNLYPNLTAKLSGFAAKMMYPADDVRIVLWGDSLFAREVHTSAGTIDPTALPPCLITKNFAWYLWNQLQMRKATYRRYDYTGAYFTETGTWATSLSGDNTANGGPDTAWDDEGDRPAYTRISDSTTAAFAWTLGITDDESGCNLIYRTDTAGDAAAKITVTQGNGYLEYWTGAAWAEANAATFSMLEADEGARRGNTIYNKRLKLRKTTAQQNAIVTVTIGKATADADRLLYWGVELYDEINGKFIPQLVNSARGGHTLNTGASNIYDYMDDDVLDQNPDIVIFEIPLLNMIASAASLAEMMNSVQDVIWGDRSGATNAWNLKTISSNWADFQLLVVIPHHSLAHYTAGNAYTEMVANVDGGEIYNAVKSLVVSHGDVAMVDLATAFEREIDASTYDGDYYTAIGISSVTGATYTTDGVHQNDLGTLVYARHLCPILDISSF